MRTSLRRSTAAVVFSRITPPLVVLGLATWVISPRFAIGGPSLIDDWNALLSAPGAVHDMLRLDFGSGSRFRPAWILWNWVQWRVPGAPEEMIGPNLVDIARIGLLVGGLTALTWLVAKRRGRTTVEQAMLCALPALVVVTVPAFDQDLARFGPEEPALVGGLALGGAVMCAGARRLVRRARPDVWGWAYVGVGFLVWCYGLFQKETSVCLLLAVVVAAPIVRDVRQRTDRRDFLVGAGVGAVALVPLLAMLYQVARIVHSGNLVYGARVKTGAGSVSVFVRAFKLMHPSTQSFVGFVLVALVALGVVAGLGRRHLDWVQLAILVVSLAALEMSAQTNIYESRYYLPTLALLAVGAARTVSRLPPSSLRVAMVVALAFCLVSASKGHTIVRHWASGEQEANTLVSDVRARTSRGCGLTITGVDDERTHAIAGLVRYPSGPMRCGSREYVLTGPEAETSTEPACSSKHAVRLQTWNLAGSEMQLFRCD